jgi:hypothetical protein
VLRENLPRRINLRAEILRDANDYAADQRAPKAAEAS